MQEMVINEYVYCKMGANKQKAVSKKWDTSIPHIILETANKD